MWTVCWRHYCVKVLTYLDVSFLLTLTQATAVVILNSTLLYCEPIAHFTIVRSTPQTIQSHILHISQDKEFTHIPLQTYTNDFK